VLVLYVSIVVMFLCYLLKESISNSGEARSKYKYSFFTIETCTKGYSENLTSPAINPFNDHGGS